MGDRFESSDRENIEKREKQSENDSIHSIIYKPVPFEYDGGPVRAACRLAISVAFSSLESTSASRKIPSRAAFRSFCATANIPFVTLSLCS